jgi:8-oxo-dGTP pyrophosphatase MutT (NUDIX family)
MSEGRIRPIALCVCRDGNRILVAELYDHKKDQAFYRPLGGAIEFGERSEQAVRREFIEEIGAELAELCYLGTLENIFTHEGRLGHEIVLLYEGRLADPALYERESLPGQDPLPFRAVWKNLDEFNPQTPVYPDGLIELLGK